MHARGSFKQGQTRPSVAQLPLLPPPGLPLPSHEKRTSEQGSAYYQGVICRPRADATFPLRSHALNCPKNRCSLGRGRNSQRAKETGHSYQHPPRQSYFCYHACRGPNTDWSASSENRGTPENIFGPQRTTWVGRVVTRLVNIGVINSSKRSCAFVFACC